MMLQAMAATPNTPSRPRPPSMPPTTAAPMTKPEHGQQGDDEPHEQPRGPPVAADLLVHRRVRCVGLLAQVDLGHLAVALGRLEELPRCEVEHPGDDVGREHLDLVVVGEHAVVVELPREGDLVLGRGELLLKAAGSSGWP